KGATAAAAGAAGLLTPSQTAAQSTQAPAVVTKARFKAWISRGDGRGRTTLQEVILRPIAGRQVVVRTEATNLCYSNVGAVLGVQPNPGGPVPPVSALAPPPGMRRMNCMAGGPAQRGVGTLRTGGRGGAVGGLRRKG